MTITCSQVIASIGLAANFLGGFLLYKGTWAFEPEPGLDIASLSKETADYAHMEIIKRQLYGTEAKEFFTEAFIYAFRDSVRRNLGRLNLNRTGILILMVGFIFQLIALWLK